MQLEHLESFGTKVSKHDILHLSYASGKTQTQILEEPVYYPSEGFEACLEYLDQLIGN